MHKAVIQAKQVSNPMCNPAKAIKMPADSAEGCDPASILLRLLFSLYPLSQDAQPGVAITIFLRGLNGTRPCFSANRWALGWGQHHAAGS